eukprot:scaffold64028_cov22-Cyclotella_meneghiniana.AAC.1
MDEFVVPIALTSEAIAAESRQQLDDDRRWVRRCNGTSGGDTASVCIVVMVYSNSTLIFAVVRDNSTHKHRQQKRFS